MQRDLFFLVSVYGRHLTKYPHQLKLSNYSCVRPGLRAEATPTVDLWFAKQRRKPATINVSVHKSTGEPGLLQSLVRLSWCQPVGPKLNFEPFIQRRKTVRLSVYIIYSTVRFSLSSQEHWFRRTFDKRQFPTRVANAEHSVRLVQLSYQNWAQKFANFKNSDEIRWILLPFLLGNSVFFAV